MEISFEISSFKNVEELEPSLIDPQEICSDGAAKGGVGPFGLLVLASKDIQEYTAVYFRVFRAKTRYVVLMCSDQRRYIYIYIYFVTLHIKIRVIFSFILSFD